MNTHSDPGTVCGALSLSGCAINNIVKNRKVSSSENKDTKEKYDVQLVFENVNCLSDNEMDAIVVYDINGNLYSYWEITNTEENHTTAVYTQDFRLESDMLGRVDIHVDEGEEVFVYIDYLNKTLNVETKTK